MKFIFAFILLVFGMNGAFTWEPGKPGENWQAAPEFNRPLDWSNPDYKTLHAALFFLTQEVRKEVGLPPLIYGNDLEKAAWDYSKILTEKNILVQDNPGSPRLKSLGTSGKIVEIISTAQFNPGVTPLDVSSELMDLWMAAPIQKSWILSPEILSLGCGAAGRVNGDFWQVKSVFTFLVKGVPAPTLVKWGSPISSLKNPRYFGIWKERREAYTVDFPVDFLTGDEKVLRVLAITRPGKMEFSGLFIKLSGKKGAGLLDKYKSIYGQPGSSVSGRVEGDTEPATIIQWNIPEGKLKLYVGETNTYVEFGEQ